MSLAGIEVIESIWAKTIVSTLTTKQQLLENIQYCFGQTLWTQLSLAIHCNDAQESLSRGSPFGLVAHIHQPWRPAENLWEIVYYPCRGNSCAVLSSAFLPSSQPKILLCLLWLNIKLKIVVSTVISQTMTGLPNSKTNEHHIATNAACSVQLRINKALRKSQYSWLEPEGK